MHLGKGMLMVWLRVARGGLAGLASLGLLVSCGPKNRAPGTSDEASNSQPTDSNPSGAGASNDEGEDHPGKGDKDGKKKKPRFRAFKGTRAEALAIANKRRVEATLNLTEGKAGSGASLSLTSSAYDDYTTTVSIIEPFPSSLSTVRGLLCILDKIDYTAIPEQPTESEMDVRRCLKSEQDLEPSLQVVKWRSFITDMQQLVFEALVPSIGSGYQPLRLLIVVAEGKSETNPFGSYEVEVHEGDPKEGYPLRSRLSVAQAKDAAGTPLVPTQVNVTYLGAGSRLAASFRELCDGSVQNLLHGP